MTTVARSVLAMSTATSKRRASGMCDAGRVLNNDDVVVGARVAVPFTFRQHAVHFEGAIVSVPDGSVSVSFPDERRPWQVQRDRLFEMLSLEDVNVDSA